MPKTGKAVGIDVGIEKLLTASDGWFVQNPKPMEKSLMKIKKHHRELSRKIKGSKNWEKARIKLAKAYEHLTSSRRDLYFKVGKYLANNYDVVVMENIKAV